MCLMSVHNIPIEIPILLLYMVIIVKKILTLKLMFQEYMSLHTYILHYLPTTKYEMKKKNGKTYLDKEVKHGSLT